jgi:hypothetical protein
MDRSATVVETVDDAVKSAKQVSRAAAGSMKAARDSLRGGKKRLAKTTRQAAAQRSASLPPPGPRLQHC